MSLSLYHQDHTHHVEEHTACAACGARWVEDRGSRLLEHHKGCAFVAALNADIN